MERELKTLEEAVALLDEWIEAYRELEQRYVIKHRALTNALFWADHYRTLAEAEETLRLHGVPHESAASAEFEEFPY